MIRNLVPCHCSLAVVAELPAAGLVVVGVVAAAAAFAALDMSHYELAVVAELGSERAAIVKVEQHQGYLDSPSPEFGHRSSAHRSLVSCRCSLAVVDPALPPAAVEKALIPALQCTEMPLCIAAAYIVVGWDQRIEVSTCLQQ